MLDTPAPAPAPAPAHPGPSTITQTMSGRPSPAPSTGDPAADTAHIQQMIADAVAVSDDRTLQTLLAALRAADADGRTADAARASSGASPCTTVTILGVSYALRREDVLQLIRDAEAGAARLPPNPDHREPLGPLADRVPAGVEVHSAEVSFELPAGLELTSSFTRTLRTREGARVTLRLTPAGLHLEFGGGIEIDAFVAENMTLYSIDYDFHTLATSMNLQLAGDGVFDARDTARTEISNTLRDVLAGTPLATRGYDPLHDPDIVGTAQAIARNWARRPADPSSHGGASDLHRISGAVTVSATSQVDVPAGPAMVRVQGGSPITIAVQGSGSAADLARAASPQATADAAGFESATVTSQGIVILSDGQPVVRLTEVVLHSGGRVEVTRFELMGTPRDLSAIESVLGLLFGAAQFHEVGVSDRAALELAHARGDDRARFIPGLSRQMLENGISGALQQLVNEHPVVGGVDLRRSLGMSAH
jgi:hypothetical protein